MKVNSVAISKINKNSCQKLRRVPVAELKEVFFWYNLDDPPVLRNLNLTIYSGDTVAVVGESGSGKSTLGYLLSSLAPSLVYGRVKGHISIPEENGTYLGQNPETNSFCSTVLNELAFPLENRGIEREDIAYKIALRVVEEKSGCLGKYLFSRIEELSGGWLQRICAEACLIAAPSIVVLDEPTSMLSEENKKTFLESLSDAFERFRESAFVIITHEPALIRLCTRCIRMSKGTA
ncbi:MAG: ABC transporter ATP-binding protein, partial [Thermoplasmata archaeon]